MPTSTPRDLPFGTTSRAPPNRSGVTLDEMSETRALDMEASNPEPPSGTTPAATSLHREGAHWEEASDMEVQASERAHDTSRGDTDPEQLHVQDPKLAEHASRTSTRDRRTFLKLAGVIAAASALDVAPVCG